MYVVFVLVCIKPQESNKDKGLLLFFLNGSPINVISLCHYGQLWLFFRSFFLPLFDRERR